MTATTPPTSTGETPAVSTGAAGAASRSRWERNEGRAQVGILLFIGGVAGAASFRHVHDVAASHGQPGWLAWADAIVLELMSIATGLEIRRRARAGRSAGFVAVVLVVAVLLSLAAQVVEAERSVIGWIAAALPALAFLACVKIVLSRTSATTRTVSAGVPGRDGVPATDSVSVHSAPPVSDSARPVGAERMAVASMPAEPGPVAGRVPAAGGLPVRAAVVPLASDVFARPSSAAAIVEKGGTQ